MASETREPLLSHAQALAARRAAVAAAALIATLLAHAAASGGHMGLTRMAPFAWLMLVGLTVLCGRRRGPFVPRGRLAGLTVLGLSQLALHALMTWTPWAFGIAMHHQEAFLTPAAVASHACATLVLGALLARGERLLALALR